MSDSSDAPRIAPEPPNSDTSGSADQPVLNVPLVEQIITHFIDHPEEHNQRYWGERSECGTTHCLAGVGLLLTPGIEFRWTDNGYLDLARVPGGRWRDPDDIAAELMGIDEDTAYSLFFDYGDTGHMIGRLKDLLNEASPAVAQ